MKLRLIFTVLIITLTLFSAPVYSQTPTGEQTSGTQANDNSNGATINWRTGQFTRVNASDNSRLAPNTGSGSELDNGEVTKYLKLTNFGFSIPSGATINGVEVKIERRDNKNPQQKIQDSSLRLVVGGVITGNDKADTGTDWPRPEASVTYGGSNDLWGTGGLTEAQVEAADFGLVFSVKSTQNTGRPRLDYISINVYYTIPSNAIYAIKNGGNWNDLDAWSNTSGGGNCNCTPTTTSEVHIGELTNLNINMDGNVDVEDITIYNGSTLNSNNHTINLSGNWTNNNSVASAGFTESSSTIIFDGSSAQTITHSGGTETFHDVQISNTSADVDLSSTNLDIDGNLTIDNNANLDSNNDDIFIAGNWDNNETSASGGFNERATSIVTFNGTATQTITHAGGTETFAFLRNSNTTGSDVDMSSVNLIIEDDLTLDDNSSLDCNNNNITIAGNWDNNENSASAGFKEGTGTVTFNGSSTQTISHAGGTETFYNLRNSNTSGNDVDLSSTIADIDGTLTLDDNSSFDCNSNIVNIAGDWDNNEVTASEGFKAGTGTVVFNGTGTQTITHAGGTATFYHFRNSNTSGNDVDMSSLTLDINGNLTLDDNSSLDCNNNNIVLAGNWDNNETSASDGFKEGTGTVTFNGGSVQSIDHAGATETFYGLTFSNANGFTTSIDINVSNTLTMNSGNLTLNSSKTISLGSSPGTEGTLSYTSGIVIGKFQHWVAASSTSTLSFPIGTATNTRKADIKLNSGTSQGSLIVEFSEANPGNNGLGLVDGATSVRNTFSEGYWSFTNANGFDCTNFDLDLDGTGMTSYTIGSDTRILARASVSNDWSANGTHAAAVGNVAKRTGMNILSGEFAFGDNTAVTWYSYQSGNWNSASSWTLDGGVLPIYNNPGSETPISIDNVVISTGKTITLTTNSITTNSLEVTGELDVAATSSHNFTTITGAGIIKISGNGGADNFPSGTITSFVDASTGGTVEVNGTGITLSNSRTFNNLNINLTSGSAVMTDDYTLNGNLQVTSGDFQINDNSATTVLDLTVNGNVTVNSGATITVGTGNTIGGAGYNISTSGEGSSTLPATGSYDGIYHQFTIGGDLTNNGSIKLTNQSVPDYNSFTSTGAANLFFTGAADNTATLNGTTDLYNLQINKGSDQTYILTVHSTSTSNFLLYGPNVLVHQTGSPFSTSNPEVRKALWIRNGTLKLTGFFNIPTLAEGYNFNFSFTNDLVIPQNGCLWVAGDDVKVYSTARTATTETTGHAGVEDNYWGQGLAVYGKLRVSAGVVDTRNSYEGLIFYPGTSQPEIVIEGGDVTAGWLRDQYSSGKASFIMSGGTFNLTGGISNNYSARFGVSSTDMTFNMSGGTINLGGNSRQIDFIVNSSSDNYNVTGGKVVFNMQNATNNITVPDANLWDVEINSVSGSRTLAMQTALKIGNDLTINANATLDTDNTNDYDVTIGADMTVSATGTYTHNDNTTTINGIKLSRLSFGVLQTFNNLTIAKTSETQTVDIVSAPTTAFQVNSAFRLESGVLNYESYNVSAKGTVYVADTVGQASNTGKFMMDGGSAQTMTSSSGVFHNLEINNSNGVSLTSDDLAVFNTLTLTSGVFDINENTLTMSGSTANISGSGFGTTKMIQTSGNATDGGLIMYVDANESITFPIGTDANATTRYTPCTATITSYSDDGYIQMRPADETLATTVPSGGNILSYYWRVSNTGFSSAPNVSYVYTYATSDDDSSDEANFVPGKVLDGTPFTRSSEGGGNVNTTNNTITFNAGFAVEDANYTAGRSARFVGAPDVYYSRVANGNWNTASTWSKNESDGTGTQEVPATGSIAVIQSAVSRGNRVNVYTTSMNDMGAIQFDSTNIGTTIDNENCPRLQFHSNATYELGVVSGTGMISFDTNDNPTVNGDFGAFGTNTSSYYLYFGVDATITNIPTPIPNLMMESNVYQLNQAITTNGNLIVQGNGTIELQQDIEIKGDIVIGYWLGGTIRFASQATAITATLHGNVDFTGDPFSNLQDRDLIVEANGTNNVEHKLILKGNIIHGSENGHSIDLWRSNTTERVILELQGESDNTYSRTSTSVPELYRLVMNKGSDQTNKFTFNDHFTLNGTTNSTTKALELQNGTLVLNDASFSIDLTTGSSNFSIPAESALEVTLGTVNASGSSTGIALDGLLKINGGTADFDDGSNNNYIEYSTSGNAQINISSGNLYVGSAIRRNTSNESGILNYTQTGGTVLVGNSNATDANRGMFEVLNSGSNFTYTGGTLTIVRQNTASPSFAAVYLDPTTSDVSGSTLYLGNGSTPSSQSDFRLNSNIALNNLTIGGSNTPTVKLFIRPLTVGGILTINSNNTFDANGLDLTLTGSSFANAGTYTSNNNTTIFSSSSAQAYSGAGSETIYNLTKSGGGTLTLSKAFTISNDLNVSAGTFFTSTNSIDLKGDATIDGTVTSTSGNGLIFSGSSAQTLSRSSAGTSDFDILTINNSNGVNMPDGSGYNFDINNNLRLQSGVFNIGAGLLTLSTSASITEVSSFSSSNMIQTNSSFTDNGVKKEFNAIASSTPFTFPVGESIYTPVAFTITASSAGSLIVRPANEQHPSVVEDSEAPNTEITDSNNALQYHWVISASGITGFSASATFTYDYADAVYTSPYTAANYIPARLFNASTTWDKAFGTSAFNEASNNFTVSFSTASDATISGDYTAGVGVNDSDVAINGAIPDNVPTYETDSGGGGDYDSSGSWSTSIPAGGPVGAAITVKNGDELTLNNDGVRLLRTTIEDGGTLVVDATTQHRLGTVSGSGTIKLVSNGSSVVFPAGYYNDFFTCVGGSLEYAGTGNYNVMSGLNSVKNLTFSDGGTRDFSNNDVTVCNDFVINGPDVANDFDRNITVQNNMSVTSGTFNSGSSSTIDVDGTLTVNGGTYEGGTGGSDTFGALTISSGTFNVGSGGSITVEGNVTYSSGTFTGGSSNSKMVLGGSSNQNISGAFTGAAQFHRLEINNSAGATLLSNMDVNTELLLTSGLITPGANDFTLNANATCSPETGSSSSYVNGKLIKTINLNGSFIFPIGDGVRWGYAGVSNVSTGGRSWEATYVAADPRGHADVDNATPTDAATIQTISGNEYWIINDGSVAATGITANVALRWDLSSDVSAVQAERETMQVMDWNDGSSTWDNYGGGSWSSGHSQSAGDFTSTSTVSFSEHIFTIGSVNAGNPLPISLVTFDAIAEDEKVRLRWKTAQEINNDFFTIERSRDGENFEAIAKINGLGDSANGKIYEHIDENPFYGINYYRLKQTDFDGSFTYFNVKSARISKDVINDDQIELLVYPNPTKTNNIHVRYVGLEPDSGALLQINDMYGRQNLLKKVKADHLGIMSVHLKSLKLKAGVYIVTLYLDGTHYSKKLKITN